MMRFSQRIGQTVAVLTLTSFLVVSLAGNSHATIVGAKSTGDELAGGRIKVTFAQQGSQFANIVAGGPGQGIANLVGFFSFNVTGDTFLADWSLRNDTTFDDILLVEFDLSGTMSQDPSGTIHSPGVLFDDNTPASTPNSFAGRKGAVQVSGPTIFNSFEVTPWGDPMNLGDEWVGEVLEYDGFGPLMTSVWRDDTDIVGVDTGPELPEPTSLFLAALGFTLFTAKRRRLNVA